MKPAVCIMKCLKVNTTTVKSSDPLIEPITESGWTRGTLLTVLIYKLIALLEGSEKWVVEPYLRILVAGMTWLYRVFLVPGLFSFLPPS